MTLKRSNLLCDKVTEVGYNIVIPKVGVDYQKIVDLTDRLCGKGYSVHLTLVHLNKEKATLRALKRYKSTDRYIPLAQIFDAHAEYPIITYFVLKDKHKAKFSSFGIINTDVDLGQQPVCTDLWQDNPAGMFTFNPDLLF